MEPDQKRRVTLIHGGHRRLARADRERLMAADRDRPGWRGWIDRWIGHWRYLW